MARLASSSRLGSAPDTYFFSLAQASNTFATVGSDDCLRLFDLTGLSAKHVVQGCHSGVLCLASSTNDHTLYTAGRDGLIRTWDTRSQTKTLEIKEPKAAGFSAIAYQGHYIAAGTESTKEGLGDVSVHLFDTRKSASPLRTYGESHTDTITAVAWHPSQHNVLLTGSTDGLVSLFDVDQADEEDALQQVLNPRSAVHCSGFLADDRAYVLSTDEQFAVYGLDKTGIADEQALPVAEFGDVRPKLDCMYVIDLLQSPFVPSPILAHGHNEKQKLAITLLDNSDYAFGHTIDLPGAHGEEVARDVLLINESTIVSCGEDGHVKVWSVDDFGGGANDEMDISDAPMSSSKKKRRDKKNAERFTPY